MLRYTSITAKNAYEKVPRSSKNSSMQNSRGVSMASSPSSPRNQKEIKARQLRERGQIPRGKTQKGKTSRVERSGRRKIRVKNRATKRAKQKSSGHESDPSGNIAPLLRTTDMVIFI